MAKKKKKKKVLKESSIPPRGRTASAQRTKGVAGAKRGGGSKSRSQIKKPK
jgi:hypothetical protein